MQDEKEKKEEKKEEKVGRHDDARKIILLICRRICLCFLLHLSSVSHKRADQIQIVITTTELVRTNYSYSHFNY